MTRSAWGCTGPQLIACSWATYPLVAARQSAATAFALARVPPSAATRSLLHCTTARSPLAAIAEYWDASDESSEAVLGTDVAVGAVLAATDDPSLAAAGDGDGSAGTTTDGARVVTVGVPLDPQPARRPAVMRTAAPAANPLRIELTPSPPCCWTVD